jgi:hypothetical protein
MKTTDHEKAGQRYGNAVQELIDSMIDLAAIETELAPNGGEAFPFSASGNTGYPDTLGNLRHGRFATTFPKSMVLAVLARRAQLQESN